MLAVRTVYTVGALELPAGGPCSVLVHEGKRVRIQHCFPLSAMAPHQHQTISAGSGGKLPCSNHMSNMQCAG